jgi:undecaprenyl-diphosphatase
VREWDLRLFDWINHWPQAWNPFLKFFSVALNQGWVKVGLFLLIVAMMWRGEKTRKAVLLALISIGIANTMTNVAKEGFPMNRPFQDREYALNKQGTIAVIDRGTSKSIIDVDQSRSVILRVGHSDSKGTASAHSANMAALALTMCYFLRRWGGPWVAVALLTGISRIYTGAHYPSQVLMGWACGLFASFVVIKTWEALVSARGGVQSEEQDEKPELA